ncbi:RNA-binding S4 domain-containing protein [Paracoccus gahaiensis]|uniref:RNA-binding S4 domain-containing protein n=1 Tax=Paracoccus gahaiensis TaxID=1706839 RepID=A0A4V5MVW2_9RHOB|nr:RNA-binding S4 domain-containing protein [Paracoccus gahaiensis]TJZ93778.1 RNA-binding S4 domain-containing protein [Paracoccus gahaiensis]
MSEKVDGLRLDKWLCHARVFKTRGLAAARIEGGGIRVNGQPCRKPGRAVRPGDRLTVSAHGDVRAMTVLALGERRGPPAEAQALYRDDSPPEVGEGS